VTVAFLRERPGGEEEWAHLSLRVVGVCDGPRAYVPLRLARDLSLWQAGRLLFNEARRAFELPAERALKAGHGRCTLFARDAESVREVVRALRRQGYHTEDSLADQDGLRRLAHVLVFLVGFFALGCVLNAGITVLITTMMSVKSKVWEIGILRAQGLGTRDVLSLFAAQGALIGGGAFLLAVAAVALVEPWLRGVVSQALAFNASVLSGSPFEASLWWLPALVLGVSLGFSLAGVLVPAALACRLSPVEALRKRE
jgi:ABC-type lipoprotein release transport system permease subunit